MPLIPSRLNYRKNASHLQYLVIDMIIIKALHSAQGIPMDLHHRKLVVLTQEEAKSSVLCEDTSVAHPKVDVKELSNSSQSNSKHFRKLY